MAAPIIPDRVCAQIDGDFVVFLIGMRVNKWWKPHKWLPPALAMMRMQRELRAIPVDESGCLGTLSRGGLTVQYWRSFDHLEAYAQNKTGQHLPAWQAFNASVKNSRDDVGIWHETYLVRAGDYETLYSGMPPFGLAAASASIPATGPHARARNRLGR